MPGILQKLRSWWSKDATEVAEEEASMTQAERDVAQEDYEARKDDIATRYEAGSGAGAGIDFERDSEAPPRD
jgi:hypothetical protein